MILRSFKLRTNYAYNNSDVYVNVLLFYPAIINPIAPVALLVKIATIEKESSIVT